jgi:hypothetical protein
MIDKDEWGAMLFSWPELAVSLAQRAKDSFVFAFSQERPPWRIDSILQRGTANLCWPFCWPLTQLKKFSIININ